jgi:pheromone shutdown protein TraB
VRVTLRRAWRALGFWKRSLLLASFLGALFERQELSEDDLRELRRTDVLSRLLSDLGEAFPGLKTVLIDERDAYLAERIRETPGRRVLAVVGAGHLAGLVRRLETGERADLGELSTTPPPSRLAHALGSRRSCCSRSSRSACATAAPSPARTSPSSRSPPAYRARPVRCSRSAIP